MAAAIIAITPSALDKKLSPSPIPISQFDPLGSGQCIIVWVLHLQLVLDQPSQTTHFHVILAHFSRWIQLNKRLKTTMTATPNAAVSAALPLPPPMGGMVVLAR
jgi:hypothetical protein